MSEPKQNIFHDYYCQLLRMLESGKEETVSNHDRMHNAAIVKLMLKKSSEVNMFCGSMSVFRNDFYKHIERQTDTCTADDVRTQLADALDEYLSDETKRLNIVLERQLADFYDDMIISKTAVQRAIERKRLNISYLSEEFLWKEQLSHFSCAPDEQMVRVENDKAIHNGIFAVHIAELSESATENFRQIQKFALTL